MPLGFRAVCPAWQRRPCSRNSSVHVNRNVRRELLESWWPNEKQRPTPEPVVDITFKTCSNLYTSANQASPLKGSTASSNWGLPTKDQTNELGETVEASKTMWQAGPQQKGDGKKRVQTQNFLGPVQFQKVPCEVTEVLMFSHCVPW